MDNDFYQEIRTELRNRSVWEEKQAVWYRMRYEGIKRAKKPYPFAPDMHYALADTMIEKLKPFYVAQIYGQERLAGFVSGKPQSDSVTSIAEKFFDYAVKQQSNFERTIYTGIDHMLMYSRGPTKNFWDHDKGQLRFSNVRPIYLIVPSWTEELGEADWLVHVLHLSKDQYKKNKEFNQDDTFLKSIIGRGSESSGSGSNTAQEQNILRREGITVGESEHQIVLWEVYSRNGDKIMVDTISPMAGPDEPVRDQFGLPYKHGEFPFTDIRYELADIDYYAPRGVTEILAHDELALCKTWNHKLQFLDFHGQPNFKNTGFSGNPISFENSPGRILPQGIEPVEAVSTPLEFKDEMQLHRALAEDRVQVPDLSAGQHLTGTRGAKGEVTATQISALVQQSSGGNDMRSRVFKLQLSKLYGQAWSLICQYSGDKVTLEDFTEVPPEALHDQYRISPSGSADSYSKEQRVAKAMAYYQTFQQNPFVKQDELTKWTFEQDDSALVQRLFQEPADAQADEQEKQAEEIVLMLNDFPAKVHPGDDDKTHLVTLGQWVEAQQQKGIPIAPDTAQLMLQHGMGHAQAIQQKKDKQGMMLVKSMAPVVQLLQGIAQQGQQSMGPQPGIPPGGMPPPGGQPPPPDQSVKESVQINYKDAPPDIQRQMEAKAGFQPSQLPPPPPAPVKPVAQRPQQKAA